LHALEGREAFREQPLRRAFAGTSFASITMESNSALALAVTSDIPCCSGMAQSLDSRGSLYVLRGGPAADKPIRLHYYGDAEI
jgi:hypothetical protein